MRFAPLLALVLALVSVFLAVPGWAADKKEASFGKAGSGAYLTKEQLRDCLTRQSRTRQQNDDAANEKAALTATKAELVQSGDQLKAALDSLDRTDAAAVAAYNEQATAREKKIDEFQARVDAFNAKVQANDADRDAFVKACENRRYFEEDEIAIRKEKK